MRPDVPATVGNLLTRQGITVTLYKTATPAQLVAGTAPAGTELYEFCESVRHSEAGGSLRLRYHQEFSVADMQPANGDLLSIKVGGYVAFNGVVDDVRSFDSRDLRFFEVSFRARDRLPAFREYRRMTGLYSVGTEIAIIAQDVAKAVGLSPSEYDLPSTGVILPHDTAQLADLTAWDMLEQILFPALRTPFVDARGVLRTITRDITAPPVVELALDQVVSISSGSGRSPLTNFRLIWLDPTLTKVHQQERVLTSVTLTAGFFSLKQTKEVTYSQDGRLRADDVRMVVRQSVNDGGIGGIVPVGVEEWIPTSDRGGRLEVTATGFQQGLAVGGLGALTAANFIPEPVVVGGLLASTGFTIPEPRAVAKGIAESAMWLAVLSIGQGIYDFVGRAWDMVHALNEAEAYDQGADPWIQKREELRSDFIMDESHAISLAQNELVFRLCRSAEVPLEVVDDLRYEPGDVLGLPDGRRYYVLGYERELSRGAEPVLNLQGFFLRDAKPSVPVVVDPGEWEEIDPEEPGPGPDPETGLNGPIHDFQWGGSTALSSDSDTKFQVLALKGLKGGMPGGSTGTSQPIQLVTTTDPPEVVCTIPKGFDPRRAFGARSETRWSTGNYMLGSPNWQGQSGYLACKDGYETWLEYEQWFDGSWPYNIGTVDGETCSPWTVAVQWHQYDGGGDIPTGSRDASSGPPVSLEVLAGQAMQQLRVRNGYWDGQNKGQDDYPDGAVWFKWALLQKQWVHFLIRIVHAASASKGKIQLWRNGVDLGTVTGKTMDVFTSGPYAGKALQSYLQFGLYRWSQNGDRQVNPKPNQWKYLPESTVKYRNIRYRVWDQHGSGSDWS